GAWFTAGYQTNKSDQIVAGIIVLLALAIVIDLLIVLAGRLLTPWERGARVTRRQHPLGPPMVGGAR
ncbi:MAG: ABC transporter permease, partial [Mycobacterium sp.]